jgi:hypothetical protein
MNTFEHIAEKIILEQALIIGPVAWGEAKKVAGLTTDGSSVTGLDASHASQIIDDLVARFERLFGRASREVCKEACASLLADLPANEVPSSLRA